MKQYYSTGGKAPSVTLKDAVIKGLAPDNGLYMPSEIRRLPESFFTHIGEMSFKEIALTAAEAFFGDDIPSGELEKIVCDTLSFDTPVVKVKDNVWALELFHGPTLAFKDVGGRFMARMLSYFISKENSEKVTVLVATSGDTGSAVANGFLGVEGIEVIVLYPKGKVSALQEKQFATLGKNITALEIDGSFDDCQSLVKKAFLDRELNDRLKLTSANSINVARFLPQSFYYFHGYAQLKRMGYGKDLVISVPSGNFGNITAGLFAKRMGLPVKRFIAANNRNDVFFEYLKTGEFRPRSSVQTIANAMDVGNPSNFARILALYENSLIDIRNDISGCRYNDDEIKETIRKCLEESGYLLDPHGACAYHGLEDKLFPEETGLFLETAHPAKFREVMEKITGQELEIPEKLKEFMSREKLSLPMDRDFGNFKEYLMSRI